VGEVKLQLEEGFYLDPLQIDGSKIWIRLKDSSTQGWDFGVLNPPPIPLSDGPTEKPLLDLIGGAWWQTKELSLVKNTVTGKGVFGFLGDMQNLGRYSGIDSTWLLVTCLGKS
jgi:hypothetical protein